MSNVMPMARMPWVVSSSTRMPEEDYHFGGLLVARGYSQQSLAHKDLVCSLGELSLLDQIVEPRQVLPSAAEESIDWYDKLARRFKDSLFILTDTNSSVVAGSVLGIDETDQLKAGILALAEAADHEGFEDGMRSAFARNMRLLIMKHGTEALKAFQELATSRMLNAEVIAEGLRLSGRLEDHETRSYRFWLLTSFLEHRSSLVRDAASLALADMDDPRAMPFLQDAIEREPNPSLKEDLKMLVDDLGV